MDQAQVIVLLLSADFFASDECVMLMQQALIGKARVIPLLVRPAAWQESPLVSLTCLPPNGLPVISWKNPEEAFYVCYQELRRVLEQDQPTPSPITQKSVHVIGLGEPEPCTDASAASTLL